MELQITLDCNSSLHSENNVNRDGDSSVVMSLHDNASPKLKEKKQTRQWAAWTHQEEESFFSALRQVGKNFEKITCRVQSKNKDQVRHYYYRLVRRMNKLLGPGLSLNAKNSKDTNAAMLRWWSLLEKYSCKASKLHLKPRRFKLFVETLGGQLLKDRTKRVRKRVSQGKSCSMTPPSAVSNQSRFSGPESRVIKAVLVDNQNIQKIEMAKGSSLQRNLNLGINRGNTKARSTLKTSRHQQKTGVVSKAAYKRWEKAAIAGVSLVADAAEHLERTTTDKEVENVQDTPGLTGSEHHGKDVPSVVDNTQSSLKLKLQLFPIYESTRKALELDSHNPHLELTLSTRKRISSVLEHLNRKWGQSSVACGELMLLPYFVQSLNLAGCHKWTKDSTLSAADVYLLIGSPPVFRLRYGWFSGAEPLCVTSQAPLTCAAQKNTDTSILSEQIVDTTPKSSSPISHAAKEPLNVQEDSLSTKNMTTLTSFSTMASETTAGASRDTNTKLKNVRCFDHPSIVMLNRNETATCTIREQDQNLDQPRIPKAALSAVEWADSLTNISVGDLLSEVSRNAAPDGIDLPESKNFQCLQQIPYSCDSFDAAIAAHIDKHQSRPGSQPPFVSHASSIWDGEDTCDAFAFRKNGVLSEGVQNALRNSSSEIVKAISAAPEKPDEPDIEESFSADPVQGADFGNKYQFYQHTSDNTARDLNGLTDIYWPDSLGALGLDISSCRYRSDDLILSDSLGGLNRLIASSLDAFQNCSFFGSNKKESSRVETGEIASDLKISTDQLGSAKSWGVDGESVKVQSV